MNNTDNNTGSWCSARELSYPIPFASNQLRAAHTENAPLHILGKVKKTKYMIWSSVNWQ